MPQVAAELVAVVLDRRRPAGRATVATTNWRAGLLRRTSSASRSSCCLGRRRQITLASSTTGAVPRAGNFGAASAALPISEQQRARTARRPRRTIAGRRQPLTAPAAAEVAVAARRRCRCAGRPGRARRAPHVQRRRRPGRRRRRLERRHRLGAVDDLGADASREGADRGVIVPAPPRCSRGSRSRMRFSVPSSWVMQRPKLPGSSGPDSAPDRHRSRPSAPPAGSAPAGTPGTSAGSVRSSALTLTGSPRARASVTSVEGRAFSCPAAA